MKENVDCAPGEEENQEVTSFLREGLRSIQRGIFSEPEKQPKEGGVIRKAKSYECYKVSKVTIYLNVQCK